MPAKVLCVVCGCTQKVRRQLAQRNPYVCNQCSGCLSYNSPLPLSWKGRKLRLPRIPQTLGKTFCGIAEVRKAQKLAEETGWTIRIIPNANHCTGCYARTDAVISRPITAAEKEVATARQRELVAYFRKLGWKGRGLLKAAWKNYSGQWRVHPQVVRQLLSTVPEYDCPRGPLVEDCLALLLGETPRPNGGWVAPLAWYLAPDGGWSLNREWCFA